MSWGHVWARLECLPLAPTQGDSAKTKEANSKDYNSTHKKGDDFKSKGQDYMATGQHKYENAKASADKHTSSFYHSTQDKTHSAKDTVAQKTHEVGHNAKAQADDVEDESLSKSEKAKEKVSFQALHLLWLSSQRALHQCTLQCQGLLAGRHYRPCALLLQRGCSGAFRLAAA